MFLNFHDIGMLASPTPLSPIRRAGEFSPYIAAKGMPVCFRCSLLPLKSETVSWCFLFSRLSLRPYADNNGRLRFYFYRRRGDVPLYEAWCVLWGKFSLCGNTYRYATWANAVKWKSFSQLAQTLTKVRGIILRSVNIKRWANNTKRNVR